MTVQFGMRPQIMGWPMRVGGDIRQGGSAAGLFVVLGVLAVALWHPLATWHLLWDLRAITGPVLLYLLTHAVCVRLLLCIGGKR